MNSSPQPFEPDEASSPYAEDLRLVRQVLAGSRPARTELVARLGVVRRVLVARNVRYGRPLDESELEDVIQDALVVIWRKLGRYEGRGCLDAFCYRVAVLELASRLRSRRRLPDSLDADRLVRDDDGPERLDDRELVERCLERLGPPDADVLRLRHLEDRSFDDIAGLEGISQSAAKSRYYRGLRKLRGLLGLPEEHP